MMRIRKLEQGKEAVTFWRFTSASSRTSMLPRQVVVVGWWHPIGPSLHPFQHLCSCTQDHELKWTRILHVKEGKGVLLVLVCLQQCQPFCLAPNTLWFLEWFSICFFHLFHPLLFLLGMSLELQATSAVSASSKKAISVLERWSWPCSYFHMPFATGRLIAFEWARQIAFK